MKGLFSKFFILILAFLMFECQESNNNDSSDLIFGLLPSFINQSSNYTIGGTITGLVKSGLVLRNDSGEELQVATAAISFTFTTKVAGAYNITISTQPTGLPCTVSNGSGTATANISNVTITCGSDGSLWTSRTLPTSVNWRSVAFGNGVFIAVAFGSNIATTSP
ncbi:MAG: hypothetical protein ACO1NV_16220 [Leptospira bouyouniensis]